MKKVIISGYYGFDNAGDEAILASLSSNLKRRDIEVVAISANPSKTEKIHSIRAIGRGDFRGLIGEFKGSDLLISGGGSLLQDVTSNRTIPYYLGIISLAKLVKLPVFFCGQGVGPVRGKVNRSLIRRGLRGVAQISVRDEDSKKLLEEIGVKQGIRVTADPVFLLEGAGEIRSIFKDEDITLTAPTLGVSIRPWKDNSYLGKLARILDGVRANLGIDIILVPLHYPDDLEVSRRVEEMMVEEVEVLEGYYRPKEILEIIGRMDLFLGVRLHSLIFASLKRVPLLGISYDPKIVSFLKSLGLEPIGEVDSLDVEDIVDNISKYWGEKIYISNKVDEKINKLEGLARENIEIALRLLGDIDEK